MSEEPAPPKGLLPWGRNLLTVAGILTVFGLALGVFPYLVLAVVLTAAALAARALDPVAISVEHRVVAPQVRAGDDVPVTVRATWPAVARGAVVLHTAVPDAFPLAKGSNFHAFPLDGSGGGFTFSAKATRRGLQRFGPTHATLPDPLAAGAARVVRVADTADVIVQAASPAAPHVKSAAAWGATMLPAGDRAVRGVTTNDFRELRPYEPGDPLRSVNWKATARASTEDVSLIVNQYEVEGKKAIWIFLDAGWYTAGGSSTWTTFDELAAGAITVARHFLDRGHRVGVTLYGAGEPKLLHPDIGSAQERRITNLLTFAEPGAKPAEHHSLGLGPAVERARGFLAREKPLAFVFTLIGRDATLEKGVTEARALSSTGRRPGLVAVLAHTRPDSGAGIPGRFVALREALQTRALEKRGVRVARWDPKKAPLAAVLMRGTLR